MLHQKRSVIEAESKESSGPYGTLGLNCLLLFSIPGGCCCIPTEGQPFVSSMSGWVYIIKMCKSL